MSDKNVQINLELDWDNIEEIFKKPKVSASFNEGYKESEKYMRSVITNFYSDNAEEPTTEEINDLLSEFKKILKGKLLVTALSYSLINHELNLEGILIKFNAPENQIALSKDIADSIFILLMKNKSDDNFDFVSSGMLS